MMLKRSLGLFDAASIGIGAIVGAGIFVVTGVASGLAGPALLLSLLIGAVIAGFSALSFAELARFIPKEGGGYEFARELISPFGGFIAGWMWIISNLVVGAAVAIGFASYLNTFIDAPVNLVAAIACVLVTIVNLMGGRESGLMNDALVLVKIAILAMFVVIGFGQISLSNFHPFAPKGGLGVMQGAALIFFAYAGFARITLVSEEVNDPRKTIPKAIVVALVLSTVIYLLVAFTAIGLVGYKEISSSGAPLSDAAMAEGKNAASLISVGALAATLGVLLTTLLGLSRISFAMARRRDMPAVFARLGDKTGAPIFAVLILGSAMTIFATFSTLLQAAAIANFAALIYYGIGNYSALRLKEPDYPRAIPVFGLISCIVLVLFLSSAAWVVGGTVLGVGIAVYLVREKWAAKSPRLGAH